MAKILVVEDDLDIAELERYNLDRAGHQVTLEMDGRRGYESAKANDYDLLILDLMLPSIDGLEICRLVKQADKTKSLPILMISAKGAEDDVVKGLDMGADDYITKPFSPRILLARVDALLRRNSNPGPSEEETLEVENFSIHPGKCEVRIDNEKLDLSRTEFRLLHLLARKRGWVFTRSQIVHEVHGADYPVTDRSVDVQVVGLRKKLGKCGDYIETVRGVGYRFRE